MGILYPDLNDIAYAIVRRDHVVITPTSDDAMNLLALSEQVPINVVYLTNGRSKEIKVACLGMGLLKLARFYFF